MVKKIIPTKDIHINSVSNYTGSFQITKSKKNFKPKEKVGILISVREEKQRVQKEISILCCEKMFGPIA